MENSRLSESVCLLRVEAFSVSNEETLQNNAQILCTDRGIHQS